MKSTWEQKAGDDTTSDAQVIIGFFVRFRLHKVLDRTGLKNYTFRIISLRGLGQIGLKLILASWLERDLVHKLWILPLYLIRVMPA